MIPHLPPAADRIVGAEEVERLQTRLVPEPDADLSAIAWAPAPLMLGEGWDNAIWDVGSMPDGTPLGLRVARRELAVELLAHELVVLRRLAACPKGLPMRTPRILATADAAMLALWYPGRSAEWADAADLVAVAPRLAATLARIHTLPIDGVATNPVRGCPLVDRDSAFAEDLERADLPIGLEDRVRAVWADGLAAPRWTGRPLLLHGDPHPGNVVLPDDGGAPVLIDFGDTTPGDPAGDMGGLWLFDPSGAALDLYRAEAQWASDDALWDAAIVRSRAWAVRYAVAVLTAGSAIEGPGLIARDCLEALG